MKISVLKISAKNLGGRKEESGFLFVSQALQGFPLTQMEEEGGDWEQRGRREKGKLRRPQESPRLLTNFLALCINSLRPECWRYEAA